MGMSADAHLAYGFDVDPEGEDSVPAWEGDWGFDVSKVDVEALVPFLEYPTEYEDDEDSIDVGDWLGAVLKRGNYDLLKIRHFGYSDGFPQYLVCIKRLVGWAWDYTARDVTELVASEPTDEELKQLVAVAQTLGVRSERIGWKLAPSYG